MSQRLYSQSNKSQEKKHKKLNLPKVLITKIALAIRILTSQTKKEKCVYNHIYGMVKNNPSCFKSAEKMYVYIKNKYGVSRSTCIRAMKELVDNGIVIRFWNKKRRRWEREIAHYLKDIDIYDPPPEVERELWKLEEDERRNKEQDAQAIYADFTRENDQMTDHAYNTLYPLLGIRKAPVHNPTFVYNSAVSTKPYVSKDGLQKIFITHPSQKKLGEDRVNFLKSTFGPHLSEAEYYTFDYPMSVLQVAKEKYLARIKLKGKPFNPIGYYQGICKKLFEQQRKIKSKIMT